MVFAERFERIDDAIARERQIKGWNRTKKLALVQGQYDTLPDLSRRKPKA